VTPPADHLAATACRLLEARAPAASICPSEVARVLWRADATPRAGVAPDGWRAWMPAVRAVAAELAEAGVLQVTRGAEVLVPSEARDARGGPIRLRRGPNFAVSAVSPRRPDRVD
jgi:hypothetical protein